MYNPDIQQEQKKIISVIKTEKLRRYSEELARFKDEITDPTRMQLLEATLEAGSSNWLTTLPIKEHGFYLEKQAFWDTLYLRYNIQLRNLPSHCVCGKTFSIDHALSCPKGEFISLRHNELRDFTAKVLDECHTNVKIEPVLTPLTGKNFPTYDYSYHQRSTC